MVSISRIMILLSLLLVACSNIRSHHAGVDFNGNYDLEVSQNHKEKYFDVKLKSRSNRNICIEFSQWPRPNGILYGPPGRAKVIIKNEVLLSIPHNYGHCNKGLCAYVIPPGQSIQGKISYQNFTLNNSQVLNTSLKLEFTVEPWSSDNCDGNES